MSLAHGLPLRLLGFQRAREATFGFRCYSCAQLPGRAACPRPHRRAPSEVRAGRAPGEKQDPPGDAGLRQRQGRMRVGFSLKPAVSVRTGRCFLSPETCTIPRVCIHACTPTHSAHTCAHSAGSIHVCVHLSNISHSVSPLHHHPPARPPLCRVPALGRHRRVRSPTGVQGERRALAECAPREACGGPGGGVCCWVRCGQTERPLGPGDMFVPRLPVLSGFPGLMTSAFLFGGVRAPATGQIRPPRTPGAETGHAGHWGGVFLAPGDMRC